MLKAEEQMELVVLKKHGGSIRGLSRLTGRSRNTVRRYLRGGDEVAKRKAGRKRAEKLDSFKTYISRVVAEIGDNESIVVVAAINRRQRIGTRTAIKPLRQLLGVQNAKEPRRNWTIAADDGGRPIAPAPHILRHFSRRCDDERQTARSLSGFEMPNPYRAYALTRLPKIISHLQAEPRLRA
jgi:hypothetical protein